MLSRAGDAKFIKGDDGWTQFEKHDDLRHVLQLKSKTQFKGEHLVKQDISEVNRKLHPDRDRCFGGAAIEGYRLTDGP
jgi:hypothetical protein